MSFSRREGATPDDKKSDEKDQQVARTWRLLKFSSVGIEMAVATFIGWGIGYWLDSQLGTEPWLMLVFLLLGVAAGFKGVFRAAREAQEIMRASDAKSETPGEAAESKEKAGAEGKPGGEDRT